MKKTSKILSIFLAILMVMSIIPITSSAVDVSEEHKHTKEVIPATVPTTTQQGHTRGVVCSTCGEVLVEEKIIPALNEDSFATLHGDDLIGVLDKEARTLTIYGTGTIEEGHNLTSTYDKSFGTNVDYVYFVDTVIITEGVTGIGDYAFRGYPIDTFVIADSVKAIGESAFYESEVEIVTMGDGVESIGDYAFRGCYYLTEIELGKSVKTIAPTSFFACENLKAIKVDSENPHMSVDEHGVLYGDNEAKIVLCLETLELTSYVIPDTVTEICSFAFCDNSTLTSITIPESVKTISAQAFRGCDYLKDVYYSGTQEQWSLITVGDYNSHLLEAEFHFSDCELGGVCGENAMWYLDETTGVFTVSGTGAMYDFSMSTDNPWNEYRNKIKKVIINEGITTIGEVTFNGCDNLKDVEISDTVTAIQYGAFSGSDGLESINIPDSVIAIGDFAFYSCTGLKELIIPEGVTSIGASAFANCSSLTSIVIPDNVTSVGGNTFKNCTNLTEAIVGNGLDKIKSGMFTGCSNLTSVTFGNKVEIIQDEAFFGCTKLAHIILPEGVSEIGDLTFRNCYRLSSIAIPVTMEKIGVNAFTNCYNLTDVYYSGTEEQWNTIVISDMANDPLFEATKHFNSVGLTHSYEATVILPTCTEHGYTTHICGCGDEYIDSYVEASGHNYEAVVTAPTCTEQGYTTYICDCGDSYVSDYVDVTGHTEESVPAVEPTCTETGLTAGVKCSVCDEVFTEQKTVPALGHSHTSEITTSATHTTTGVMTYTCACGDTYTETIDKLAEHNHNAVITAPTCTEQGYTTYTCSCGDIYVDDYVDATGHTHSTAVEENYVVPTCTESGSVDKVVYCSVCGEEISRETIILEATGHADNDGDGYCDMDNELLDPTVECNCNCHKSGVSNFFFKFILFFQRLFGSNKECACGVAHY